MVATVVKPLSVSAGTVTVLALIENYFLGSLPWVVLFSTIVGPFFPLVAGTWARRKTLSVEDTHTVFEPLYVELGKNKDAILSSEQWANIPMFQRNELEAIRKGARYSLLKSRVPAVEQLCGSMDIVFNGLGDSTRAATRIIREATGPFLGIGGEGVSFRERPKEEGAAQFESSWTLPILIRGRDPVSVYREHGIYIESMNITDKANNIKGTLTFPADEKKYRAFWGEVEKVAKDDPHIKKMRDTLGTLPGLAGDAETQVMKEIRKSRRAF